MAFSKITCVKKFYIDYHQIPVFQCFLIVSGFVEEIIRMLHEEWEFA